MTTTRETRVHVAAPSWACDFHIAIGQATTCDGWHSGGVDGRPSACDVYVDVIDAGATIAWAEVEAMRAAYVQETVDDMLDTLHGYLADGVMPCGCRLHETPVVRCDDHAATMTAKYPEGVIA